MALSPKNLSHQDANRIGQILVHTGAITEEDLAEALAEAKRTGSYVGMVLVKLGRITREQLGTALAQQHNTRYVSLSQMEIDPTLLDLLPEEFIRERQVMPLQQDRGRLVVVMVDPSDRSAIDEITFLTGMRPQVTVTTAIEFQEACIRFVNDRSSSMLMEEISSISASTSMNENSVVDFRQQQEAELTESNNPLVKLVNAIIEEAIERNASDIHIEPRTKKYLVRFRVDGILKTILDIPQNMETSFVTRVKVMSRMDIAEHRRPQDGRISIKYKGSEYNLRVNTLPVGDNREKMVIRILRPSKQTVDFNDLGFSQSDVEKMEYLYKSPYGIVLVCGPTGSGKTTTLYTILHMINDDMRNISTVEDPVELSIEGLNQSQVNAKADYTFASSMRALLRQDPDVIMVGEIRDYETLEAAIHAALTGHLVFSTIHSNTTSATITRMIEMGASSSLISSALVGVVAQRLVRSLCPHCTVEYSAPFEERKMLFPFDKDRQNTELILKRGEGCDLCGQTGHKGRTGLYEIMLVDREIRALIGNGSSDMEIEDAAVSAGMRTLGMCGRDKVIAGETSFSEVTRVLGVNFGGH